MIKLSASWDYAIKSTIYIAESNLELIKIKDIAKDLNISEWFLRRIIASLEKWGILISLKWRNWGIKLAKEKNKISLFDILSASGEEMFLTWCTAWKDCPNSNSCNSTKAFNSLQKGFNSLLKLHTIDRIINSK